MISIFSFGLLPLHILKIYAILSLEKAVLATFWASSLGGARIRHQEQNPDYLDFSNHLGHQLIKNKQQYWPLFGGCLCPVQPGLKMHFYFLKEHHLSKLLTYNIDGRLIKVTFNMY